MDTYITIVLSALCVLLVMHLMIKPIEQMVVSDSTYSDCKVGCIIACSNKYGVLQKECYGPCTAQCWNY